MEKRKLREEAKNILSSLSIKRREEASFALLTLLLDLPYKYILSFNSLAHEIDTRLLNDSLFKQNRLLLPQFETDTIIPVLVESLDFEVVKYGVLTPKKGKRIKPDLILVPALYFDEANNRLGRGKGYYDRLLASYNEVKTFGIGFKEQLYKHTLPTEEWDQPVSKVLLY